MGSRNKDLGRHHLKLSTIFFVIAFGIITHLLLDLTIAGVIRPLYPFLNYDAGLNLIKFFPEAWSETIIPSIEAGLLILWLISVEIKHKISDFI
jgi:membrane-bound metal-dependent hydrolase YbcI (DUF457 family)